MGMKHNKNNMFLRMVQFSKKSIKIQGAPKKMYHSDLYTNSVLEVGFYFFTYFRIILSRPFNLDIQTMPILDFNCLKNAKKHARTYDFLPILGH